MEAMKLEIAQLKESLTSLSTAQVDAGTRSSYANRVAAGAARAGSHRPRRRQEGKGRGNVTPPSLEPSSGPQINPGMDTERSSATSPKGKNKVRVVGARRIWGTLKNSTASIVKSVISRLCKVDGEIRVRRKDKEGTLSKRSMWWYVVHGDEPLLTQLESKWDQVNLQTSWKLEPCFMTEIPTNSVQDSPSPVDAPATVISSDSQPALSDNLETPTPCSILTPPSQPQISALMETLQSDSDSEETSVTQQIVSTSGSDHFLSTGPDGHAKTM